MGELLTLNARVLTKAHHVKLVFQDSHRHTKAHANNSGYLMEQLLGSCAGLISGNSWKAVKQAVQEPFLHKHTSVYVEDVRTFVHDYLRTRIPNETEQHGLQKFHIIHDLKFIPFLFVARIIFGPLSVGLERKLEALIPQREALFRKVIQGGMSRFALLRHLPLSEMNELRDFKRRWKSWNDEAHTHALLNATDSNGAPILDMYADMETGKITQEQLLQTIDEILFANLDVMMNGLSWVLVFLAANISVQADLREEIRANESPELRATYLSGPGLSSTTLLTACILESARLRPAAAFSVPQSCPTARNLDGYEVPAGTNFVIDSYALNIRDPFWGKDRDKFQPRRWKKLANNRDLRYQYWRFGFAPRTCMGKYVADLILTATIVEVLNKWQISLSDTTKGFSHQTDKGMPRADEDCDMDWPWDDEMWIHHPDMTLYCTAFSPNVP